MLLLLRGLPQCWYQGIARGTVVVAEWCSRDDRKGSHAHPSHSLVGARIVVTFLSWPTGISATHKIILIVLSRIKLQRVITLNAILKCGETPRNTGQSRHHWPPPPTRNQHATRNSMFFRGVPSGALEPDSVKETGAVRPPSKHSHASAVLVVWGAHGRRSEVRFLRSTLSLAVHPGHTTEGST